MLSYIRLRHLLRWQYYEVQTGLVVQNGCSSASIDAPSTEEWKPKNALKNSYKAEETLITSTARLANQQNKIK